MKAHGFAFVTVFSALPAMAQPTADSLPLGLDQLHWMMSGKDVASQMLNLAPPSKVGQDGQITNQDSNSFGPYRWRSCVFNLKAYYSSDRLSWIFLDAFKISPDCKAAILDELNARYGNGKEDDLLDITKKKIGEIIRWSGSDTGASYNGTDNPPLVEISLSQKGGPPLVIFDSVP